jgi:tRNA A-37 threonylcarbamoyl transferase component Bud32
MKQLGPNDPRSAGRHRLLAVIGQGAMGRVLLGRAPDGRLVAVKTVHRHLARSPEFRERFRLEVQASQRVTGAYTAAVMDADPEAAEPWLASMYVPGPSLREAVEQFGPLPPGGLRLLTAGLAAALLEIHRAGMIHRDLKPANVLLGAEGPRVIDFGIARALETQTQLTSTGSLIGSPAFMSPEQAEGYELTTASDVFSVGGMLVLAATGHNPFPGESTPQTLYNVVHTPADTSGVPTDLRPVVEACLQKNPAYRPTAEQLLDAAGRIDAQPVWPVGVRQRIADGWAEAQQWAALPDEVLHHRPRRRMSRRLLAGLSAAVAVVIAAGVGVYFLERPQPEPVHLAITTAQLRLLDPCKLLGADVIGSVGQTSDTEEADSTSCSTDIAVGAKQYKLMLDAGGGVDILNGAKRTSDTAGGLPILDDTDDQMCVRAVIPASVPTSAIRVLNIGSADCSVATAVLKLAVDRLATDPPLVTPGASSIVPMDPCTMLSSDAVRAALGSSPAPAPSGVHECDWVAGGYNLGVELSNSMRADIGNDPSFQSAQIDGGQLGPLPVIRNADSDGTYFTYYLVRPTTANMGETVTISLKPPAGARADDVYKRSDSALTAVVAQLRK